MKPGAIPAALVSLALAACSGGKKKDDTTPVDDRPPKKAVLSWGTTDKPPKGDVPQLDLFLEVTEETGKMVSYPVGTFDGACTVIGPIPAFQAITAINCVHNQVGFQLHASAAGAQIVVSKLPYREGAQPDPFTRQEVTTIPVAVGSKIEARPN